MLSKRSRKKEKGCGEEEKKEIAIIESKVESSEAQKCSGERKRREKCRTIFAQLVNFFASFSVPV